MTGRIQGPLASAGAAFACSALPEVLREAPVVPSSSSAVCQFPAAATAPSRRARRSLRSSGSLVLEPVRELPCTAPPERSRAVTTAEPVRALGGLFDSLKRLLKLDESPTFLPAAPPSPEPEPVTEPQEPLAPLKINVDLAIWRAKEARKRGEYARARELARWALNYDPKDGRGWLLLATMAQKEGDMAFARELLEQATAANPDNAHLWQSWALLEEKAGDLGRARKLFDAATVADKRHAPVYVAWAQMEVRAGDFTRARELFEQSAYLDQDCPHIWQSWGLMEKRLGNIEAARRLFERGVRTNPRSAATYQAWALMEAAENEPERARELFMEAVNANGSNALVWHAWAKFELEHAGGEGAARAAEVFRLGTEANWRDGRCWQGWATLEADRGNAELARDLFWRGAVAEPREPAIWQRWGCLEQRAGNARLARHLFRCGLALQPRNVYLLQAWALLESSLGRYDVSRELFECAVAADPKSLPAWSAYQRMEERAGNVRAARGVLARQLAALSGRKVPRLEVYPGTPGEAALAMRAWLAERWGRTRSAAAAEAAAGPSSSSTSANTAAAAIAAAAAAAAASSSSSGAAVPLAPAEAGGLPAFERLVMAWPGPAGREQEEAEEVAAIWRWLAVRGERPRRRFPGQVPVEGVPLVMQQAAARGEAEEEEEAEAGTSLETIKREGAFVLKSTSKLRPVRTGIGERLQLSRRARSATQGLRNAAGRGAGVQRGVRPPRRAEAEPAPLGVLDLDPAFEMAWVPTRRRMRSSPPRNGPSAPRRDSL